MSSLFTARILGKWVFAWSMSLLLLSGCNVVFGPDVLDDLPCSVDADCSSDQRCIDGLCVVPEAPVNPGECSRDADCEDGNPCTLNSCNQSGECIQANQDSADDNEIRCGADGAFFCQAGRCLECRGVADCEADLCFVAACNNGSCLQTPDDGATCDADGGSVCSGGSCVECHTTGDCTLSENRCSKNVCVEGACTVEAHNDGANCPLDDETGGVCNEGSCVECNRDESCNDGNPCTVNSCSKGEGVCVEFSQDAGTVCQTNLIPEGVCNSESTCVECVDNAHCGEGQFCVGEECVDCTENAHCTEGNASCTAAVCMENGECGVANKENGVVCTDLRPGTEELYAGTCVEGRCVTCQADEDCPSTACTTYTCNTTPGHPDAGFCMRERYNEGAECNFDGGSFCKVGECVECLEDSQCDDSNACTNDTCNQAGACVSVPVSNGNRCGDDVNGDQILDNVCLQGTCVDCLSNSDCFANADNVCADDVCNANNQCVTSPRPDRATLCSIEGIDDFVCIAGECSDACVPGAVCGAGGDKVCSPEGRCGECASNEQCNDNNPCTTDTCGSDPETGDIVCLNEVSPNGTACGEGLACTAGECTDAGKECEQDSDCVEPIGCSFGGGGSTQMFEFGCDVCGANGHCRPRFPEEQADAPAGCDMLCESYAEACGLGFLVTTCRNGDVCEGNPIDVEIPYHEDVRCCLGRVCSP